MEEEEDPIIEEIPVFLSRNLQNNLFLFQYPNKSNETDLDSVHVVNCCMKPINHEVKVDFGIDTESKSYDRFKGKQFAIASDGKNKDSKSDRPSFKTGIMDKQSYMGTKPIEKVGNYVVGYLKDKEIHLSPLANIFQMRPSFSYFDKEDKRNKAEQKAANEEDDDEELQQVTVKFSRNDTERLKGKVRDNAFENQQKKSADEPWCETSWHSRSSPTAELGRMKLLAGNRESIGHSLSLNGKEYLQSLIPQEASDLSIETILPSKIISKSKLKTLNLTDQLKNILKDGKMMSFVDIMSIVEECDRNVTTERVLRTLPLVGILIRGNWVAQSEILYPPESLSNANGVSSELMVRGRNYVLYKFMKQEYLHRRKIIISTQLPPEEATEILQSVGRLNSEKKWEILIPPDVNFESRYADIAQRQEMVWRPIEQMFLEMDFEKSPKRVRKRSIREVKTEKS